MDNVKNQLIFFFIFIILICIITYFNIKKKTINELFTGLELQFSNTDISDSIIKDLFNAEIITYNNIINKYTNIDPGLNVNNNGKLCDKKNTPNNCKINTNTNDYKCLVFDELTSCSKLFSDGKINSHSTININVIKDSLRSNIIRNSQKIISDMEKKKNEIDNVLNTLIEKTYLKNQQEEFVRNNNNNLSDKKKTLISTTKDYEKNENDVFVNQYNFKNYLIQNEINNDKLTLYRNIMYGFIITIIIVLVMFFFVS